MADLLPTLLSFPPDKKKLKLSAKEYETSINAHIKNLNNIPDVAWTKTHDKKSLLELLDPAVNSVSYLYTLNHQVQTLQKDSKRLEPVFAQALVFLTSFDPIQVRYVGEKWRLLFEWVCQIIDTQSLAASHAGALAIAILRLDPSAGTFTTNHLRLLRLCLKHGVPSLTLPVLDKNIYAYPQKSIKAVAEEPLSEEHELSNAYITEKSGFSLKIVPEYVLEYYLLGAHVYIGMRNFDRARLFLECVILSPTQLHAASALQVEAYKKWVLLGLLADGKSYPFPRTADQQVIKSIKAVSKAYTALAEDFEKRDQKKFMADAEQGSAMWAEDGNLRLVAEAEQALVRYRVIDLQRTYAALPVARVAAEIGVPPQQAMQVLTDIIRRGHLNATISTTDANAVLRFHPAKQAQFADDDLEAQTHRITELVTFVRDADRRLQLTKEYVDVQRRNKRTGGPDGDLADAMDLTWDAPIASTALDDEDEEDIMAS